MSRNVMAKVEDAEEQGSHRLLRLKVSAKATILQVLYFTCLVRYLVRSRL